MRELNPRIFVRFKIDPARDVFILLKTTCHWFANQLVPSNSVRVLQRPLRCTRAKYKYTLSTKRNLLHGTVFTVFSPYLYLL